MSGDRLIYLGTVQEIHDGMGTWGVSDNPRPGSVGGTTLEHSLFERRILDELSDVPGDHQIYISSNKIDNEEDCHHGITKRIASRLAQEGYPPTKKCVDCGMVTHMVWGPWMKPIKQP